MRTAFLQLRQEEIMAVSITLEEAQRVLEAALAECRRRGFRAAVAVVDDHGDLVTCARLDGARTYYADVATGKAMSAAIFEESSRTAGRAPVTGPNQPPPRPDSVPSRVNAIHGGRIVYAAGAVPLMKNGTVIGAVGVGGSGPDTDEEVAIHAAGTVSATPNRRSSKSRVRS